MSFAEVVERLDTLENPYPGLRPFDIHESHLFFGRDLQVADIVSRLERHRFVAVLGASGSGKSSLVRAGLIPALDRGSIAQAGRRWRTIVTEPSGAPFERLGARLESAKLDASRLRESSHGLVNVARQLADDESLLVVVDQFEELFRYKDVEPITEEARRTRDRLAADAAEFAQLLMEASRHHPPIYVVLTMRSDYLGDCAEFRDLPETLNDCQYLVPRLTRQQRKEAIEGPLGRVAIAPSLVQRMLNDAGDEPDQLPVLQHALMRTWSHWRQSAPEQRRRIELQDYEGIGAFDGALNLHADELLAKVPEEIAKCVFKRLTARGQSHRERRDPATLGELWAVCGAKTPERQADVTGTIDQFRGGDATFLRPLAGPIGPDTYIDITHESLIRLWKKLRDDWLPEEQASAKTLVDLADQSRNWKTEKGELLGGLDLARVEDWDRQRNRSSAWARHYVDEATLQRIAGFIAASRARERVRRLRTRVLWSTAVSLVLILVGWTAFTSIQTERARQAVVEAAARAAEAQAREEGGRRAAAEQDLLRAQTDSVRFDVRTFPMALGAGSSPLPGPKPRVYIQVRSKGEAERARGTIIKPLAAAGFIVPEPEILDTGPSANQVRYFRPEDRQKAEEIVRILQDPGTVNIRAAAVPIGGYEKSERIRENHFELWLAPVNLLRDLVRQLNDPSADVRKSAGGVLARDHLANSVAIGAVLDTLSERNIQSLSTEGRINALYFLNRSVLTAWTDEQKALARTAIERVRKDRARAGAAVGPQTLQEFRNLEQKLGLEPAAR